MHFMQMKGKKKITDTWFIYFKEIRKWSMCKESSFLFVLDLQMFASVCNTFTG